MSKTDFDLSTIKGVALDMDGVLSPSTVPIDESGAAVRMGNVKDGYALQYAAKHGLKIAVITGGQSLSVANRMRLLGVTDVWQNVPNKLPVLESWMESHSLRPEEVAYMGDDIPDLKCLRAVGFPSCPYDAAWEVKQESVFISKFTGGYGAVRDLLEQILKARGLWGPESPLAQSW